MDIEAPLAADVITITITITVTAGSQLDIMMLAFEPLHFTQSAEPDSTQLNLEQLNMTQLYYNYGQLE